jgi:hypothetical protein
MEADIFARAFGLRPGILTNRGLYAFDAVAVFPPVWEGEPVTISFFNGSLMWRYSLPSGTAFTVLPVMPDDNPHETGTVPPFAIMRAFRMENPYANDFGEKLLDTIRARVTPFFDNPASINAVMGADGVYTFRNVNTVVRYYDFDVLTFASYRPAEVGLTPDILADYLAALAFIEADAHVVNDFFLTGYAVEGERHTFWFDFVMDGGLVNYARYRFDPDRPSHMEVVAERGTVIRFRKLTYTFFGAS